MFRSEGNGHPDGFRSKSEADASVAGRTRGSRNKLTEAVVCALLRDFSRHGEKAIARVRQTQPGVYLRCLTLLIPREHKVEQSNVIKNLSDEELVAVIEAIESLLAKQTGAPAKMIEGTIEPTTVPATTIPVLEPPKRKPPRLMTEVDTAIGPQERNPRKRVPSSTST